MSHNYSFRRIKGSLVKKNVIFINFKQLDLCHHQIKLLVPGMDYK